MDWSRDIEVTGEKRNLALVMLADIESILLMCFIRREQEEFVRSLESTLWEVI